MSKIRWLPEQGVYELTVRTAYSRNKIKNNFTEFISQLKSKIPYGSGLEYVPDTKTWLFADRYLPLVKTLAEIYSDRGRVELETREQYEEKLNNFAGARTKWNQETQQNTLSPHKNTLQTSLQFFASLSGVKIEDLLSKTISLTELQKSYRKLALQFHPDRNPGNKEIADKMSSLNAAFEDIKQHYKESI
jgi:hypothetical protein